MLDYWWKEMGSLSFLFYYFLHLYIYSQLQKIIYMTIYRERERNHLPEDNLKYIYIEIPTLC